MDVPFECSTPDGVRVARTVLRLHEPFQHVQMPVPRGRSGGSFSELARRHQHPLFLAVRHHRRYRCFARTQPFDDANVSAFCRFDGEATLETLGEFSGNLFFRSMFMVVFVVFFLSFAISIVFFLSSESIGT